MRNGFLLVLGLLVGNVSLAQAQQSSPRDLPLQTPPLTVGSADKQETTAMADQADAATQPPATDSFCQQQDCCPRCFWGSAEYLLWWVRNGPINSPLVTLGGAGDHFPGGLGQPNTQVLYGDRPLDYGAFSGLRVGGGFAINNCLSLEGNYFTLERRSTQFAAGSDANGNPLLARPVFSAQDGAEEAYGISINDPGNLGQWAGNVFINSHTHLQGWELNLAATRWGNERWSVGVIAGFRALDLNEDLSILENIVPISVNTLTFGGINNTVNPPSTLVVYDGFHTINRFYGGQIGGRLTWQQDRLSVNLVGKVALGGTQETANIGGATTLLTPGAPSVTLPGGVLATVSNMGVFHHSVFGVVPEASITVGWNITERLKATFGYNFIYWSQVARPGNQIDHNVNPSFVPTDQFYGNGLGPTVPGVNFHQSGFWAQGLTFGLELRF